MPFPGRFRLFSGTLFLAACGSGGTGPSAPSCSSYLDLTLAPGAHQLVDASAESACIRFPAASAEQEYLMVAYSGAGSETSSGVSGGFRLTTSAEESALFARQSLPGMRFAHQRTPGGFHNSLRQAEADLVRAGLAALQQGVPASALRDLPVVGQKQQFNVCKTDECKAFTPITATVRLVGSEGVIYVDDVLREGAEELTGDDLQYLGDLFDRFLFPIDTTAFGAVSDLNADQRVAIVITDQVNDLSPDCTEGRIVGYFYGGDLLYANPGSNKQEVFFTFAPSPATPTCPAVTRSSAVRNLPWVLIHELQHMISFNEHVLRRGQNDESTWLNEGLSHFAEELGHRFIPDEMCPLHPSCFAQFAGGNLDNAYAYLEFPEETFLIPPTSSGPSLAGRGAAWLFVRWLADHFSVDTLSGRQLTRALLSQGGSATAKISSFTGQPFERLVGEWLLANQLENLEGFPQTGRLRYRTWNLRATYAANYPHIYDRPYPLLILPTNGNLVRNGTLRGGTGDYLRVLVPANVSITAQLSGPEGKGQVAVQVRPHLAVARIK
ncbi:MAG TPA: hypothetical protein PLL69_02425 [Gemmatimonadales bacterium]|nr:hypothetical protein [Gemmatimonadales bacterium]